MKSELTPENVKFAATFGAMAELAHRGYQIMFSILNTENVDASCWKGKGRPKKIQIKGTGGPHSIYAKKFLTVKQDNNLFLIVAKVEKGKPLEYYILSHREALDVWNKVSNNGKRRTKTGKKYGEGISWKTIKQGWNRWDKLDTRTSIRR